MTHRTAPIIRQKRVVRPRAASALPRQETRMATERRTLIRRNSDFRWFWTGQSISVLGTQVTAVALPLVAALTLGTGAGGIGLIATASYPPNALFPLFAGNFLDVRRRRTTMVMADVVRAM